MMSPQRYRRLLWLLLVQLQSYDPCDGVKHSRGKIRRMATQDFGEDGIEANFSPNKNELFTAATNALLFGNSEEEEALSDGVNDVGSQSAYGRSGHNHAPGPSYQAIPKISPTAAPVSSSEYPFYAYPSYDYVGDDDDEGKGKGKGGGKKSKKDSGDMDSGKGKGGMGKKSKDGDLTPGPTPYFPPYAVFPHAVPPPSPRTDAPIGQRPIAPSVPTVEFPSMAPAPNGPTIEFPTTSPAPYAPTIEFPTTSPAPSEPIGPSVSPQPSVPKGTVIPTITARPSTIESLQPTAFGETRDPTEGPVIEPTELPTPCTGRDCDRPTRPVR